MKETRREKRITLRELSKKTGILPSRLSDIERGVEVPLSQEIDEISRILGPGIRFANMESAAEARIKTDEALAGMLDVITEAREKYPDGGAGTMDCPKCGKPLVYTVAASNKHVHAKCSTESCIGFMM